MPCAAHKTVNSKVMGINAGIFLYKFQLGFPPISIGQSQIFMYHIIKSAKHVPVAPYKKEAMEILVRLRPKALSSPCTGKGE